jgi:REP element-mobilizing transposase RayT
MLLSKIIQQYKAAISKEIKTEGLLRQKSYGLNDVQPLPQVWQRNYYEHIIRDEAELKRVREYIINNPLNWGKDEYN